MPPVGAPEVAQLVSAIRFYCDEDSQNRALLKALRSRGVEVTDAGEAGLLGQTDEAQLSWDRRERAGVGSHYLHFFQHQSPDKPHPRLSTFLVSVSIGIGHAARSRVLAS